MKTTLLSFILFFLNWSLIAQHSGSSVNSETTVGTTKYDQQTNKSGQNRMYLFPDGTIGATWMLSQSVTPFDDRGTGYNYYNGSNWGPFPSSRIETVKSGWNSYAPYNTNGEIVVSHKALLGPLNMCRRNTKGTGGWTLSNIPVSYGTVGFLWPKMVTSGPNRTYIHVIANTAPTSNGGTVYQGLNGAILYNRSLDGGTTWMGWQLLPGMTSANYNGFPGDAYDWAEPKGDTLCFVVGDNWNDLFIMKSTDNGASWTKTIAWHCLYNKWTGGSYTGYFYCPDGSNAVALDKEGMAHVVFGRQKAWGDYSGSKSTVPFTDGLLYWNETQPQLVQSLDSATLAAGGHFIGWVQDPAVWYAGPPSLPYYYLSMSSMPTITVDQNNNIFVVWSGVTNNRDANYYLLRHLYGRASVCNGEQWCPIAELTGGTAFASLECAYPSLAPASNQNLYFLYQCDNMGGNYVRGLSGAQGQSVATSNDFRCQTLAKSTLLCGVAPVVDFSAGNVNPIVNQTVVLSDLSINCPTAWQWSFSPSSVVFVDGTASTSKNPHVQFTGIGVYSVTLNASNYLGSGTLTKTDYILVAPPPPPVSDFIANRTNIWTGDKILFTDQSTGNPEMWDWTFEGGTPGTWSGKTPPMIEYSGTGVFDVTLIVTNQWGTGTKTKSDYITVTQAPVPVADFQGDPTTLNVGSSVVFTDKTTHNPTTWLWTFEGGTPAISTAKVPPPVTYNTEGQFTVSLIAGNASGADTMTKTGYITAIIPVIPSAEFSATPTVLYEGGQVQFTDQSTGNPGSWQWTFDGGVPGSSTVQTPPPVTYAVTGIYDVTLTVANVNGNSTKKKVKMITAISPGGPYARFTANPVTVDIGGQVSFTDESLGNPTLWLWTFEGGNPGSFDGQTPPPVTYPESGMFDVTLKVINLTGTHTSSIQDYITVTNPFDPLAGFSADPTGIKKGDSVLFTDESTGYPKSYAWTFDGGTPSFSTEKSPPMIVYSNPGKFDVTLVVTNENGTNSMIRAEYISVGGVGVDEAQNRTLLIYPNPADHTVTMESGRIISEIVITDLTGAAVLQVGFGKRNGKVDVSHLDPAMYILRIRQGNTDVYRRIVVR